MIKEMLTIGKIQVSIRVSYEPQGCYLKCFVANSIMPNVYGCTDHKGVYKCL